MDDRTHPAVRGRDGLRGELEAIDPSGQRARLRLQDGRELIVPSDILDRQADGSFVVQLGPNDVARAARPYPGQHVQGPEHGDRDDQATRERAVLPVAEEQAVVSKRTREVGQVVVHVTPQERQETVQVPLIEEHVEVERVPINRFVEGPPAVREEGNVTIVPVVEEVLVVEKRLMLREEVRITRRRVTTEHRQRVTLRCEEVEILRADAPERPQTPPDDRDAKR